MVLVSQLQLASRSMCHKVRHLERYCLYYIEIYCPIANVTKACRVKHHQYTDDYAPTIRYLRGRSRITFKVATLAFKVQSTGQPSYLAPFIMRHVSSRDLRSVSEELVIVSRTRTSLSDKAFGQTTPSIQNSLQLASAKRSTFRKHFKTYLFKVHFES